MTPDESAEVIAALVAAYSPVTIPPETMLIYVRFMEDLHFETTVEAMALWIGRERRFPRITDLREAVERIRGDGAPDLDLAWREVTKAFSKFGRYKVPTFSHPAIGAAVQALGWIALCDSTEPGVDRAHFQRAYESARKRLADPAMIGVAKTIAEEIRYRIEARRQGQLPKLDPMSLPPGGGRPR